jgi:hypothetical protein
MRVVTSRVFAHLDRSTFRDRDHHEAAHSPFPLPHLLTRFACADLNAGNSAPAAHDHLLTVTLTCSVAPLACTFTT